VLERISPYLSMHMKNVQIGGCTLPVHQFEGKVVMYSELDSNSDFAILNWIGSPFCGAHHLGSLAPS
jgi:hypothetical protein